MRAVVVFFTFAAVAPAQSPPAFRTIRHLLPIVSRPTPGANGALWETELWFRNNGDAGVRVGPLTGAGEGLTRRGTYPLTVSRHLPSEPPGVFVQVTGETPELVQFSSTVRDVNHPTSWGATLPAVRDDEFTTSTVVLLNIPRSEALRHTLRIYEGSGEVGKRVRVRVFPLQSEVPLAEAELDLEAREPAWAFPAYAQITNIASAFPAVAGEGGPLRIEVEPLVASMHIWAFVSITSNDANHITIVTPR